MSDSLSKTGVPIRTTEDDKPGLTERCLVIVSLIIAICTFPLSLFVCIKIMNEYERAVIFRLGRLRPGPPKGPGIFFILPCIDECTKVDLRVTSFDVPPQEILTKDSVTVHLDAVVYYRIYDPFRAVIQVEYVEMSTRLLAQTTLRNVAGTRMLIDLLTDKESFSHDIGKILDEATDPWGVKVERVEIKDVRLPFTLQRAMAAEAEALREAKAKIVAAEGELNASLALKQASDVISANPVALQLRYLQTLSSIASEQNSTIIFPFPMELMALTNSNNNNNNNNR